MRGGEKGAALAASPWGTLNQHLAGWGSLSVTFKTWKWRHFLTQHGNAFQSVEAAKMQAKICKETEASGARRQRRGVGAQTHNIRQEKVAERHKQQEARQEVPNVSNSCQTLREDGSAFMETIKNSPPGSELGLLGTVGRVDLVPPHRSVYRWEKLASMN